MLERRKKWLVFLALLAVAAGFRIVVAHRWPNDAPDDGRVYAQIARNVLERHVYSHATEAPYDPTLIRLPGYPLFVASIYSIFGHTNNGAVRIAQALIDTATCAVIALLAFYWQPDEKRKRATATAALALAAICPFTTIYSATILTEVPTTFLVMAMFLVATLAFRKTFTTAVTEEDQVSKDLKRSLLWWSVAGLLGGLAVLFRPDSGLFLAAVGITLALTGLLNLKKQFRRTVVAGTFFSLAFVVVLAPWTIRNARVFHLFQPLAPSHGEMPGEFVPRGYYQWLRTWLDDQSYIQPFLWSLDSDPIDLEDVPPYAFDSAQEKDRVAALLDKYNHPPGAPVTNANQPQSQSQPSSSPTPQPSPTATPTKSTKSTTVATPSPASQSPKTSNAKPPANANAKPDEEDNGDEGDQNDNRSEQGNESENGDAEQSDQTEEHEPVEMTLEIDAGFAQLARERIGRHPLRFYVWLPVKRAHTMWFDTHSQYWPFEGDLLPLEDLDYEHQQQLWLPLFAGLTGIYTLLGLAGAWLLWKTFAARRWLLLTVLAILLRLILVSSMENPEPRYLVEFFPFLSILGGVAIAHVPLSQYRERER
jgi:4-amino-4-deoxy-L-arabinose transferase-like glycosyltransferase